ncbi:ribosome-recycling factor, mitochondrial [Euwallacea fornicatus]|uniref:ribosome-recycling factor, mitochondrial n=1 Tax=Euwallacea fornicatus TaxID=995702 RepID=UPI0033903F37
MYLTRRISYVLCNSPAFRQLQHSPIVTNSASKRCTSLEKQGIRSVLIEIRNCNAISIRTYAKGKDKKKEKGKSKVVVNENQINDLVNVETLKGQMEKAVIQMEEDFVKQLSLRSTTGAIESLPINLDGKEHKLQELAQIIRKNPKTIVINFVMFPQAIPAVLKALSKSGMNLNPQQDGTSLFIPIPKVTKEHREQLAKNAKQLFVKCKDSVRDVQMKNVKQIKKKDKVSEDLVRSVEQQIVVIADQFIAQAESVLHRKQVELLGDK